MKTLNLFYLLILLLGFGGCSTYKYTKYQYDEAMNAYFLNRHISEVQSKTPYSLIGLFSDGKDGNVYKYDLSSSYKTPSHSRTDTNINVNSEYNGNLSIYGTQNTTTTQSQTITNRYFMSYFTNNRGYIYKIEYYLSPKMLNGTYESYRKLKGN